MFEINFPHLALNIELGDVQVCDPKPASQTFTAANWRRHIRCHFQDLKAMSARNKLRGGQRCTWHSKSANSPKDSCRRVERVHGVIGSGSCHPFTSMANRPPDYTPDQHPDWSMIFDARESLVGTIDAEDPDFWLTENVEGFTKMHKPGCRQPIEEFIDRIDGLKDPETKAQRFTNAWRRVDQADHMKAKRKRRLARSRR